MYLLTKSETLESGVTVTFTSGTDTANIIDGDRTTSAETANRSPNLTIDLGARKVIDALWLKGENLQDYDLKASNNNITYTDIQTGITVTDGKHSFLTFTNTTEYRYWRLAFSQRGASDPNYRVHEIWLMRLLLDLNTAEKRPLRVSAPVPQDNVVSYQVWNQNLVAYKEAGAVDKARLTCEWEHLEASVVDALEDIWKGPPHLPVLTVYPRPDPEPGKIYQAKWASDFLFKHSAAVALTDATVQRYKQGQAVFKEI